MRSLPRERLELLADDAFRHRLTIVAAPAGSGKTTLLAAWATAAVGAGRRVAWYRAESTDGEVAAFLGYVELAIAEAFADLSPRDSRGLGQRWRSVEEAASWLERRSRPLILVIDDLHLLAGTPAESGLERLLGLAPASLSVVVGTRTMPSLNISRRRLAGEVLEVTGEDLRFRSWEVERLFRDYYGMALRGDELGRVARRTAGWAAGLQLFHLAAKDKPPAERSRLLQALGGSPRLIREYLARNVIDELPLELRDFLLDTCALRRLSGPLCDRFLGRTGSGPLLEELERRQIFTISLNDGTYRYHDVLQAHLDHLLSETRGEDVARREAARAARLLEAEGALAEALVAYCRAEQWDDAARVAGGGDRIDSGASIDWLMEAAPALVRNDPWLRLASARRLRAEGRWAVALDAFGEAEAAFGPTDAGGACRAERLALAAFLDPRGHVPAHWTAPLLGALRRASEPDDTREGAPALSRGEELLADGLARLAAGFVLAARDRLVQAAEEAAAPASVSAAATLGVGIASAFAGTESAASELERAALAAERAGETWLAMVARSAFGVVTTPPSDAWFAETEALRQAAGAEGDAWGQLIHGFLEGCALLRSGDAAGEQAPAGAASAEGESVAQGAARRARGLFDASALVARTLGAKTAEAWSQAFAALAASLADDADAHDVATAAEGAARAAGVTGARVSVYLALARSDPKERLAYAARAEAVARHTGFLLPTASLAAHGRSIPGSADAPEAAGREAGRGAGDGAGRTWPVDASEAPELGAAATAEAPRTARVAVGPGAPRLRVPPPDRLLQPAFELRLLGGFQLRLGSQPVSLAGIKPRPRAILRLLALNAGQPVHREALVAAFWPEADPVTAARNVNVALSSLRREFDGLGVADELLVREGEAYRLRIPPGGRVDLLELEQAIASARAAHARGDVEAEAAAYRRALELGTGDLLPEDGPAEWVVYRRESLRTELVSAAKALATLTLPADPDTAADACLQGLRLDPQHDGLWRTLIAAREQAGDHAAAASARQSYAEVLGRLGLSAEDADEPHGSEPQDHPAPNVGGPRRLPERRATERNATMERAASVDASHPLDVGRPELART